MTTSGETAAGARPAYHHGNLPQAVMAVAMRQLAEGDRVAVNFNRIAKELGVSHTAVYRHFPVKQDLVDALAHVGFERLTAVLEAAVSTVEGAEASVSALAHAYVSFCDEERVLARLMFSGVAADRHRDPRLQQAAFAAISVVQRVVAAAVQEGRVPEAELYDVTRYLWAGIHGLAMLRIEGQFDRMLASDDEFRQLIDRSVQWVCRGTGLA